LVYVISDEI
jgi:hypothetical protein